MTYSDYEQRKLNSEFNKTADKEISRLEKLEEMIKEESIAGDELYRIIEGIAVELKLESWTPENIVQKVKEYHQQLINKTNGL